jgi:hypothetical protein
MRHRSSSIRLRRTHSSLGRRDARKQKAEHEAAFRGLSCLGSSQPRHSTQPLVVPPGHRDIRNDLQCLVFDPGSNRPNQITPDPRVRRNATQAVWLSDETLLHLVGKRREELIGQFFRGRLNEAAAERRQFSPYLGFRDVTQKRAAAVVCQPHRRSAFGEADDAPVALSDNSIAVRSVDILQVDAPLEGRRYGANFESNDRRKFAWGFLL